MFLLQMGWQRQLCGCWMVCTDRSGSSLDAFNAPMWQQQSDKSDIFVIFF